MSESRVIPNRWYQRWTSALLIVTLSFSTLAEAAKRSCPANLLPPDALEVLDREYAAAIERQSVGKRMVIRLVRNRVRKRIIEACASRKLCDGATIARTVEKEIAGLGGDGRRIRGYAIVIGIMIAGAAASSQIDSLIPQKMHFMAGLISALTAIAISNVGSPVTEPIYAWIKKKMVGLGADEDERKLKSADLEEMWSRTNTNYSVNAQTSRGIINGFIGAAKSSLYILQDKTYPLTDKRVISDVAELIVRLRHLYADVDPENSNVLLAVFTAIGEDTVLTSEFVSSVRSKINQFDREAELPENKQYYDMLTEAWFVRRAR